ncbi:MAG: dipeptidase [Thermoanaerobaculia bacterium]|nr:dipeptidase [Thermoanaerobaculia bacterium]
MAAPMLNLGRCRLGAAPTLTLSTRAIDLVLRTTVVDMLGLLTLDWNRLARWQRHPESFGESDFRHLESAGVRVFHPAVETNAQDAHDGALRWTAGWNRLLDAGGCFLERVATADDLALTPARGRLGVVIGFQDADHFRSTADVDLFFGLGQRVSQLTYNGRNRLGSGCYALWDRGLTAYGGEVVAAMNRVGMAIDLSHCGERTTLEAIEQSRRPVLVTHSNCRALVPNQPRCKSDAVIRALAARGGVMGITLVRAFVGARSPGFDDLLAHFDHVARLVGTEHVGLGSDIDVDARDPASGRLRSSYAIDGLVPEARVFQLADGLLARGWSAPAVEMALGGNFRRALAEIWPARPAAPATAWSARRDPFCPAPHPRPPAAAQLAAPSR